MKYVYLIFALLALFNFTLLGQSLSNIFERVFIYILGVVISGLFVYKYKLGK